MNPRMYQDSAGSLNFYVGCLYDCLYCLPSFQRQMKRQACPECKAYCPHPHMSRLDKPPPRTNGGQFVFFPSCSDWSMIPRKYQDAALDYVRRYPKVLFLLQTKNPHVFENRIWPDNAILGITLETDRSTRGFSRAPQPQERYETFKGICHPRKMVTVEPIMDFDMNRFVWWLESLKPWRIYVGYNSRPREARLPEPPLAKTIKLVLYLRSLGVDVRTKLLRVRSS